ncbi:MULTISPECIES: hypothetical protein [unclassified Agromyces]|uniref:hypothetical protein n=1 Tax=unclassified Agromyces TaxID=2639701 RepID=UPI0030158203
MTDTEDDADARIQALGALRLSPPVARELGELTRAFEDPRLRASLDRASRRERTVVRARRIIAGAVVALAGVGLAVPAAALTSWLARTGEFGNPAVNTEEDATEWIDLRAPDAPEVVVEAYPAELRLPEGVTPEDAIASVTRVFEKMSDGFAQEGLMTSTYENFALCAWTADWLDADADADSARGNRAADWLSDPANYPTMVSQDITGDIVASILEYTAAGRAGQMDSVSQLYKVASCKGLLEGVEW